MTPPFPERVVRASSGAASCYREAHNRWRQEALTAYSLKPKATFMAIALSMAAPALQRSEQQHASQHG